MKWHNPHMVSTPHNPKMAQPSQGFNPSQSQMTQPLLMDPYTPQHDHHDDNTSNVTFSFQTSPTHGNIEWGPNQ
jgi:hypothetical protein